MAKGQMRSNREKKKPKQDKTKVVVSNSPFAQSGRQGCGRQAQVDALSKGCANGV